MDILRCWCNNESLATFSDEYLLCEQCYTLVSKTGFTADKSAVKNDEQDFYGKNYWLVHQNKDLNIPNIFERSRSDLSERCLYWLKTILKYKLPPADVLELGCSHGGFVKLMRQCGYNASGLELSPWIVDFARKTFDIPMHSGPLEEQNIPPASLDMIILMDVLEHLPDPVTTIKNCLKLLKDDGLMILQTPCYPKNMTFDAMQTITSPFLQMLQAEEHLYLFSQDSVEQLMKQLGCSFIEFEPAIFSQYDMFMVVSKNPFTTISSELIESHLSQSPSGRILQTMFDLDDQRDRYIKLYKETFQLYQEADNDRAVRLKNIEELNQHCIIRQNIINQIQDEITKLKEEITKLKNDPYIKLKNKFKKIIKKVPQEI